MCELEPYTFENTEKYLFSIEVEPYEPNKQLSIINCNRGVPRLHYPLSGNKGILVLMISFQDLNNLQREYDWIKAIHKGYYEVRKELEG